MNQSSSTHTEDFAESKFPANVGSRLVYIFAVFAGSFALARLSRVIGIALCGVGHGGGVALGEKILIASISFYIISFLAAVAAIHASWRATRKPLAVVAMAGAILFSILAELRDMSYMF